MRASAGGVGGWIGGLAGLLAVIPPAFGAEAGSASVLLFGSLEASPTVFVTAGAKVAADRIDREGFVALASLGGDRRRERAATRATAIGAVVAGYQWFRDWGVVAAYAGPEGAMEVVSGCGCVGALPPRFGLRLQGEVWARPGDETLLTATLILGSTRASAWGRLSWGTRAWGDWAWGAYLGPEMRLYGDGSGYRKWALGLHATDFALGRFSLRASAGWEAAGDGREAGPYLGLTAWTPW